MLSKSCRGVIIRKRFGLKCNKIFDYSFRSKTESDLSQTRLKRKFAISKMSADVRLKQGIIAEGFERYKRYNNEVLLSEKRTKKIMREPLNGQKFEEVVIN